MLTLLRAVFGLKYKVLSGGECLPPVDPQKKKLGLFAPDTFSSLALWLAISTCHL